MASGEKLTIHKVVFNLEVDDKNAFKHFADRFSKMCSRTLPRRLDEVLKKHDLPEGMLTISNMEVNLGDIRHHLFEDTICNAIVKQLDGFLKRYVEEIESELTQAKFQNGRTFTISHRLFKFESEVFFEKPVSLLSELAASQGPTVSIMQDITKTGPVAEQDLQEMISKAAESEVFMEANVAVQSSLALPSKEEEPDLTISDAVLQAEYPTPPALPAVIEKKEETSLSPDEQETEEGKEVVELKQKLIDTFSPQVPPTPKEENDQPILVKPAKKSKKQKSILAQVLNLERIPDDIPPKEITELDKAFLYYLRYGRLPSNVKYELGMRMLDVFNVNQKDIRFFNEIKKHIARDEVAKERLMRLTDQKNHESLIKKSIFDVKEVEDFDPKIPRAFEDYFVALVLERNTDQFSAELQRYNLNDMIRFLYADSPRKLRALLTFLLKGALSSGPLADGIESLFAKLGKASIVKVIASFVRKAGHVNKGLNRLNKKHGRSVKAAHASVLYALIEQEDPIARLEREGFKTEEFFGSEANLSIAPRVFLGTEIEYDAKELTNAEVVNYFLRHGSLPHSMSKQIPSLERLSIMVLSLTGPEILALPFFKEKSYESSVRYQSIGLLSQQSIDYLIATLAPLIAKEVKTKSQYFAINLKNGVPESFHKTFALYYALRNKPVSYLEEMIAFWKKTFGDDDRVISRRWKPSDELAPELRKILKIEDEVLMEKMKVDYEFQSYSKDISVKNAGLVILWPFLKPYFKMLDLLNPQGDFRSIQERARACHLLQYLAVKQSEGEELYYPLNKILTGYPIDEPLPYEIKMTEKEVDVSNALLNNVVKQWNALKGASVDALRGSFLIRDGVLTASTNGWLLVVEKKAYDILLDKLPWGIGMIKLSWAPYILSVEWERNIM